MHDPVRAALRAFPVPWRLFTKFRHPRLQRTLDLVLVTDRAVVVFAPTRAAAEAAAIDLADFHTYCRPLPVLPVALLQGERLTAQTPFPYPGAAPVIACSRLLLPGLLAQIARFHPVPGADPATWEQADYRPVPALLRAAADLYAGNDVPELQATPSVDDTRAAIARHAATARTAGRKHVVFVTGAPGAGKTICGLHTAFDPTAAAAFLTGNPALLHVFRAALRRNAAASGRATTAARQRIDAVIQPLHAFRDHYAGSGIPPDRTLVIDEAQRCWTADYAIRKTRNKNVKLTGSEPAHLLAIMDRIDGPALILCLLGGGQEIHAGEGGLAEWGRALAAHPAWTAAAPRAALAHPDPRQRLPDLPNLTLDDSLHLATPIRHLAAPTLAAWVDAVLADDPATARSIGAPTIRLTRSLPALRAALATAGRRPGSRAGLVASSGARRLRAEGLGGLLWHQDEDAVARWFLDPWPDIRGSDALEVAATEFGVQGLELDHVGLCWDLDLARGPDSWAAHAFRATAWTRPLTGERRSNTINTYRVLLTRARRETLIWVPRGDPADPTRTPGRYDAIAAHLAACGVATLDEAPPSPHHAAMPEPALL